MLKAPATASPGAIGSVASGPRLAAAARYGVTFRPASLSVLENFLKPRPFRPDTATGTRSGSAMVGTLDTEVSSVLEAWVRSRSESLTLLAKLACRDAVAPSAVVPSG